MEYVISHFIGREATNTVKTELYIYFPYVFSCFSNFPAIDSTLVEPRPSKKKKIDPDASAESQEEDGGG